MDKQTRPRERFKISPPARRILVRACAVACAACAPYRPCLLLRSIRYTVDTDNTITCWGWNSYGQTNAPTGTFQNVTTGAFHSCAIRTDNTITCWGWNFHGQTESPTRNRGPGDDDLVPSI